MDKQQFLEFLKNPQRASEETLGMFDELIRKYPYFQAAHLFIAKVANDLDHPDKKEKLNSAAIYTANRAILKEIIETNWQALPSPEPIEVSVNAGEDTIENLMTETPLNEPVQSQDAFDQKNDDEPIHEPDQSDDSESGVIAQIETVESEEMTEAPGRQVLTADTLEAENKTDIADIEDSQTESPDELSHRKKQQMEIIDSFINYESNLVSRKFVKPDSNDPKPQEDLSLRSSRLDDDLVSENLAMILKKQGKVDKAIDIYKKLIWKFPQKKAYFASLIEELKKN